MILSLKFTTALLCSGEVCGFVINTLNWSLCSVLVGVDEPLLIVPSLLMLSASSASSRMSLVNCWAIGDTIFSLSSSSATLEAVLSLSVNSSIVTSFSFTLTFELNDMRDILGFRGVDVKSLSSQEAGLLGVFRMPLLPSDAV